MRIVVSDHWCPITNEPGNPDNICVVCKRPNFSDSVFDKATNRCAEHAWDPEPFFAWADECRIPVTKLPRDMGELANLRILNLTANAGIYTVSSIPESLSNLNGLEELWIAAHPVKEFPAALGKLHNLRRLSLNTLGLTAIPEFVFSLPNLEFLSLLNNEIGLLPDSLFQMQSLRKLNVSANQLTEVPGSISQLQQLEEVYLWENKLSSLPQSLFDDMPNLKVVNVDGNPLDRLKNKAEKLAPFASEPK